ncbi:hypothetical protein GZH53_01665 [Flavihumibacter sp. R14]|nr:hypothetical protein [Flavihumibacter soli]
MEVFEIFVDEQRYSVYPDEWEFGIHQVKIAGGNCKFLRMKEDSVWEELAHDTLTPLNVSDDIQVQLLGRQIQKNLPLLFPQALLVSTV